MMFESLENRRLFAVSVSGGGEVPPGPGPNENANPVGVMSSSARGENGETASTQGKAGARGTIISALARGDDNGGEV